MGIDGQTPNSSSRYGVELTHSLADGAGERLAHGSTGGIACTPVCGGLAARPRLAPARLLNAPNAFGRQVHGREHPRNPGDVVAARRGRRAAPPPNPVHER
jgi:hypothetical protein